MGRDATNLAYLVTIASFIVALRFLSNPATARRGNQIGAVGMLVAIAVTFANANVVSYWEIVVGMIVTFLQHPDYLSSSAVLDCAVGPGATFPHEFDALLVSMQQMRGEAIVTLGLLVLMATPVMRVAVSTLTFIQQRDRTYALITAAVLCLLLLSLVLGRVD